VLTISRVYRLFTFCFNCHKVLSKCAFYLTKWFLQDPYNLFQLSMFRFKMLFLQNVTKEYITAHNLKILQHPETAKSREPASSHNESLRSLQPISDHSQNSIFMNHIKVTSKVVIAWLHSKSAAFNMGFICKIVLIIIMMLDTKP